MQFINLFRDFILVFFQRPVPRRPRSIRSGVAHEDSAARIVRCPLARAVNQGFGEEDNVTRFRADINNSWWLVVNVNITRAREWCFMAAGNTNETGSPRH